MTPKTIGILGGMGPYASNAFLQKILDKTPVKNDRDHIHIVLDSHPHIPSRTRYFLYSEESPVPKMTESCRKLAGYPVDAIAIPCNSASAWIEEIQRQISVPLLNIIAITVSYLGRHCPVKQGRIAVWGGLVTYKYETYRSYLEDKGYVYVKHSEQVQRDIEGFIETIKLNRITSALLQNINELGRYFEREMGVDLIIMGCTEFGCVDNILYAFKHMDSLDVYAEYIVKYAKEGAL
jgi:aspartate racemase